MQFYPRVVRRWHRPSTCEEVVVELDGNPGILKVRNHKRDLIGAHVFRRQVLLEILDGQGPATTAKSDETIESRTIDTRVHVGHLCFQQMSFSTLSPGCHHRPLIAAPKRISADYLLNP